MSNFHVGQKVVCIKREPWPTEPEEIAPAFGMVYTIRGFDPPRHCCNFTSLFLVEITNPALDYGQPWGLCEVSFNADCFRPVVERKTDTGMAILTKILDDVLVKEPARI